MDQSDEEATLINMLDIDTIVQQYDRNFGTEFSKALKSLDVEIRSKSNNFDSKLTIETRIGRKAN